MPSTGGPWLVSVTIWMLAAAFVLFMCRRPSDRSVAVFTKAYSVELTPHNVGQLRRYIQWTRRWRLGGVSVAVAAATLITRWGETTSGIGWLPIAVGYSVGSLAAELFRPVERSRAVASLDSRRVRDFVVPHFIVAAAVAVVVSLVPAVFLLATNPQRSWAPDPSTSSIGRRPQDWFVLLLVSVMIAIAAGCWFACGLLARAPFPADTFDRMAVRYAIRSAAIMSVIGGSVMAIGTIGTMLASAAFSVRLDEPISAWVIGISALVSFVLASWGGLLTITVIPHVAPFAGRLPEVPMSDDDPPSPPTTSGERRAAERHHGPAW